MIALLFVFLPAKRVASNRKISRFIAEMCYTVVYTRVSIRFEVCTSAIVSDMLSLLR